MIHPVRFALIHFERHRLFQLLPAIVSWLLMHVKPKTTQSLVDTAHLGNTNWGLGPLNSSG